MLLSPAFYMDKLLSVLDRRFADVHARSVQLIAAAATEDLFRKPRDLVNSFEMFSCGEFTLRSAGAVEQAIGGITRRLWDDPFEWTLPEELSTGPKLIEYLDEVEQSRVDGFSFFSSDDDLARELPSPQTMRSLFEVLVDALGRAEHFQGRAFAVFRLFSDEKLPRL